MYGFISGSLFAVSRECAHLAAVLKELDEELGTKFAGDRRVEPARALARRQRILMNDQSRWAEQKANAIQELAAGGGTPGVRRREISGYRRCVAAGRFVEHYVIPFLRAFDTKAMELTELCRQIAETINWPHHWPLVSRGASNYFLFIVEHDEELILVPALAGTEMLPLPDLVHEMAHGLVGNQGRRQTLLGPWERYDYVDGRVAASLGGTELGRLASRHWLAHGVDEIACDAIAAWVTGPAYAWQHIRGCWGRREGRSVYHDSDYHPPEYVRFRVVLQALAAVGADDELKELEEAWGSVIDDPEPPAQPVGEDELVTLYPAEIVQELVDEVMRGCARVGIRPYSRDLPDDDPCRLFGDAWQEMRTEPESFHGKERSL